MQIFGPTCLIPDFIALCKDDLGLHHVTIAIEYTDRIVMRGKPAYQGNPQDHLGYYSYSPRRGYTIQVRLRQSLASELDTLAHELRHVYQHRYKLWTGRTWNGERIPASTPYCILPWEIDARQYALIAVCQFAPKAGFAVRL